MKSLKHEHLFYFTCPVNTPVKERKVVVCGQTCLVNAPIILDFLHHGII